MLTKLTHFRDSKKILDLPEVKKMSESVTSLDDMATQPDWKSAKFIKLKCLFVAIDIAALGLDKKAGSLEFNRRLELQAQIASLQNEAQLFVQQYLGEEEQSQVETMIHETIPDKELSRSTSDIVEMARIQRDFEKSGSLTLETQRQ